MAVDSAVMIIDVAKVSKLRLKNYLKSAKQRHIPIFTFVNKLDRYGKAPLELMEEIEDVLGIRSYPMNWPIGTDGHYKGIYQPRNRAKSNFSVKILPTAKKNVNPSFTI